jgi:hypothetical protein
VHSSYFWPSLEQGLSELQRVLSTGGRLVLAVRLRHANARCFDPSRYGLTDDDVDAIVSTLNQSHDGTCIPCRSRACGFHLGFGLEALGYQEVIVKRQEGLDRQTMAAIIARR